MSEIQKQQLFDQDEQKDEQKDRNFEPVLELQENMAAAEAARRLMEQSADSSSSEIEATPKPSQKRINKFVIGASSTAVAAAFITGGLAIANHLVDEAEAKSFGTETTEYTANLGDTLLDVAEQVPGSDTKRSINDVIYHIETDPANLGPLSDGLQSGDKIRVPVSINGAEPIPTVEK
jgi:hypothetical protein